MTACGVGNDVKVCSDPRAGRVCGGIGVAGGAVSILDDRAALSKASASKWNLGVNAFRQLSSRWQIPLPMTYFAASYKSFAA